MDKYILLLEFYTLYVDDVDVVLQYPWMESISTININVQKKRPRWHMK